MGIARLWSTFCLRFLVCAGFRCTFALIRASNRGSYPPKRRPAISCCPPKVMPKSSTLCSTGAGDRNLKDAPVGVTLIETTHQKHQGVSFSRCVCGAPPASEEVAQPGGKPLDRQALLRRQLCLELR